MKYVLIALAIIVTFIVVANAVRADMPMERTNLSKTICGEDGCVTCFSWDGGDTWHCM